MADDLNPEERARVLIDEHSLVRVGTSVIVTSGTWSTHTHRCLDEALLVTIEPRQLVPLGWSPGKHRGGFSVERGDNEFTGEVTGSCSIGTVISFIRASATGLLGRAEEPSGGVITLTKQT